MSRLIDLLAIIGSVGVVGYFAYKVILPNLQNIQLPAWKFPDFSQLQFPQQLPPQQTNTTTTLPMPDEFDNEDISSSPTAVATTIAPAAAGPAPMAGEVLWDSNRDGKWNNGVKRIVKGTEGSQSPNGKGIFTAASGNPRLIIDGNGVAHLQADAGHGRIYVNATNYNSQLSGELMFEDDKIDNTTWKLRSRHGESGSCENRFGGVGAHLERNSSGFKIEKCHNVHESGVDKPLPKPIPTGKWIGFRFTVYDTADKKGIFQSLDIDYKDGTGFKRVNSTVSQNPPAYYTNASLYNQQSYFWIRINNTQTGQVAYKNVKLINISSPPTTIARPLVQAAYAYAYAGSLYNSFYHRRRL